MMYDRKANRSALRSELDLEELDAYFGDECPCWLPCVVCCPPCPTCGPAGCVEAGPPILVPRTP